MRRRQLDRAAHRRADDLPVALRDERREPGVVEVVLPLRAGLLERGERQPREDGREGLVPGQGEVERGECVDVLATRAADLDAGRAAVLAGARGLADRVDVLVPEAEAEPRVDELRVGRGNHRVVGGEALGDPVLGGGGVEVADQLRLGDGMPGRGTQTFGPQVSSSGAPTRKPTIRSPATATTPDAPSRPRTLSISDRAAAGASYAGSRPGSTRRCAWCRAARSSAAASRCSSASSTMVGRDIADNATGLSA